MSRRLLVQHLSRLRLHQDDLESGLCLDSHRQPTKTFADHRIRIHFKPELVAIELQCFLLVLYPNQNVRHSCDHGASPSMISSRVGEIELMPLLEYRSSGRGSLNI